MNHLLTDKRKELIELCNSYHVDLIIRYYGNREICFQGITEDEKELFNVCLFYSKNHNNRLVKYEINTEHETWFGYSITKEDMLLLLSLDDLSDEELGIKPQIEDKGLSE
jgi:hypothetical protein